MATISDQIATDRDLDRLGLDPYDLVYFDRRNIAKSKEQALDRRLALMLSGFTVAEIQRLEYLRWEVS